MTRPSQLHMLKLTIIQAPIHTFCVCVWLVQTSRKRLVERANSIQKDLGIEPESQGSWFKDNYLPQYQPCCPFCLTLCYFLLILSKLLASFRWLFDILRPSFVIIFTNFQMCLNCGQLWWCCVDLVLSGYLSIRGALVLLFGAFNFSQHLVTCELLFLFFFRLASICWADLDLTI